MTDGDLPRQRRATSTHRAKWCDQPRRDLRRCSSCWAFICLFPIYWTITTCFKMAPDVMQGALIPCVDFTPDWMGWRSLGLSPDTIGDDIDGPRRVPEALHRTR